MLNVSVIIPAYNRAHLIGETLTSLLAQTVPAVEIIVVDDGSTDDTAAVAAGFGSIVKVIQQPNAGPAAARNKGFLASQGEFIHFFDSDDLAAPNKHQVQLDALESTGADIAVSPWVQGRFRDKCFVTDNHVLQQNGLPFGRNLLRALVSSWAIVPHCALFRRSIVENSGGFSDDLFGPEDQFMFLKCLLAKAKVVHAPQTIEFYRLGDVGKITENTAWKSKRFSEWARYLLKGREACLVHGIEPLRWFGYRYRLWEAEQDFCARGCPDEGLRRALQELVPIGAGAMLCRWHRKLGRWRGGLQKRITGGRASGSFRIGPMTPSQIRLLKQLGYAFQGPRSFDWFGYNGIRRLLR